MQSNSSNSSHILRSVDDGIGWITLNRPQHRNAISRAMWDALPMIMQNAIDDGAKVIVLNGAGGAFAAGADLKELADLSDPAHAEEHWNSIRCSLNAVAAISVPTIAMIVGPCMGGGCLLASACDMRIAAFGSRFSVPVAQLGITLDEANIGRLISLVGRGLAAEMLFTGRIITAERAERSGLVNLLVDVDELLDTALAVAGQIKRNSAGSVAQLKQSMLRVFTAGPQLDEDQAAVVASYTSADFRARVTRLMETFRA